MRLVYYVTLASNTNAVLLKIEYNITCYFSEYA
jgi:hypothetical protein